MKVVKEEANMVVCAQPVTNQQIKVALETGRGFIGF